jgi:hypothetical protein
MSRPVPADLDLEGMLDELDLSVTRTAVTRRDGGVQMMDSWRVSSNQILPRRVFITRPGLDEDQVRWTFVLQCTEMRKLCGLATTSFLHTHLDWATRMKSRGQYR